MPFEPLSYPEHLPTRQSRVRGLCLGLALGDALGNATAEEREGEGPLEAGVGTELAAWSIEGTQRNYVRYGILHPDHGQVGLYGYQRWFEQRGYAVEGPGSHDWGATFLLDQADTSGPWSNGWLWEDPIMGTGRGVSPTTVSALRLGRPVRSTGCQALTRALPVAAFMHLERTVNGEPTTWVALEEPAYPALVERWARSLALLTHDDGERQRLTGLGVRIVGSLLRRTRLSVRDHLLQVVETPHFVDEPLVDVSRADVQTVLAAPTFADTDMLRRLAPDTSARSALVGGLYVVLSFPEVGQVQRALDFALLAPDPDSVASVAGAMLGALFGYEALPPRMVARLTHGWTMDKLAMDLETSLSGFQAPAFWKEDWPSERPDADVWWDSKYPGS